MHGGWGCGGVELVLFCKTNGRYEMHVCFAEVRVIFSHVRIRCKAKAEVDQGSTLSMVLKISYSIHYFFMAFAPLLQYLLVGLLVAGVALGALPGGRLFFVLLLIFLGAQA